VYIDCHTKKLLELLFVYNVLVYVIDSCVCVDLLQHVCL